MISDNDRANLGRQVEEIFADSENRRHLRTAFSFCGVLVLLLLVETAIFGHRTVKPLYTQTGKEVCTMQPLFRDYRCHTEGTGNYE